MKNTLHNHVRFSSLVGTVFNKTFSWRYNGWTTWSVTTQCPWHVPEIGGLSWYFVDDRQTIQWRHNERDGVSNHWRLDCLLSRFFRRRSKKTSKLRATGLYAGNSPVNLLYKGPVTRQMFPFDDVIMILRRQTILMSKLNCWYIAPEISVHPRKRAGYISCNIRM